MKKYTLLLIILFASLVYGGDVSRKGTTGAEELLLPVGARSIASGGAFMASVTGLEAIHYNPAGVCLSAKSEAMFNYMTYIADINVGYFAAGTRLGDFGSLALSIKSLDFGDIPITTSNDPDGTSGQTYSPSFTVFGVTYSKEISDRISVGTNFKLINEEIVNTSATGFAIDIGVQYQFSENVSIGAALNNVGSNMSFSGSDMIYSTEVPGSQLSGGDGAVQVVTEEFQLPSSFSLSFAYKHSVNQYNNIAVASTFVSNNSQEDVFRFGLEYSYMDILFLRGGYKLQTENIDDDIYGLTAGAGVKYDLSGDMAVAVDYAYRDVQEFQNPNHVFTVKMFF